MNKKRFVSTALVFALFFVMLLSTIYIIAETDLNNNKINPFRNKKSKR